VPGGRLTLQDRRDIEAGVADGLGFAEIARRLRRPPSTVSREVKRNGGHNHYRAGRAQEVAVRRARRRAPAHPDPQVGDDRVRRVERDFAGMLIDAGFPRMMARVLVALFVGESTGRTTADLVDHLGVSPASISKAVRHLEDLAFVQRRRDPGGRRERYVLDGDMWAGVWVARTEAMARWAAVATGAADVLGRGTPAGDRFAEMGRFIGFLHAEMVAATGRWERIGAT
jgi:Helix-turn-helix domain/MarR family